MVVGTRGSVKGLAPAMLEEAGCQMMLGNTYHLMLRPGAPAVQTLGGLQKFSGWNKPMLTDSGGFQVFSLAQLGKMDDHGVIFQSHIDGATVRLDPRISMQVQTQLGADIAMAFDDCPAADCPPERLAAALDRTIRWAALSREAHVEFDPEGRQALFGIVQGGTDAAARERCAAALVAMDFSGYALGGLAVGEGQARMLTAIDQTIGLLPAEKPRYLMGVGYASDILEAVKRGVDMFDCVLPTRNGRNALAFTRGGNLRLRNAQFALDQAPIEDGCDCYACRHFSRGYLRHLFVAKEMLGPILVSLHNVRFFQRLMLDIRHAIRHNTLSGWK